MSNYSDPAHTDRPNLEQKRKLAKDLLKAVKRLDGSNAARFTWNHPRFRGKTAQDVILFPRLSFSTRISSLPPIGQIRSDR